jgi:hypothetical protein
VRKAEVAKEEEEEEVRVVVQYEDAREKRKKGDGAV